MTTITDPTFDRSLLPKQLHKDQTDVIVTAVACGWTLHINGPHAKVVSPLGEKTYPFGNRSSVPVKRVLRDVMKFGDPLKLATVRAAGSTRRPGSA